MALNIISEELNGLKLFEPNTFSDARGFFMETFRADELKRFKIDANFVQDNHSRSLKNVLRGLHFQWDKPQGKLIRVTLGEALFVEVDIRVNSPTLGHWKAFELSDDNKRILWVPPGFANGFLAKSDWVEVQYKCSEYWNKNAEASILWNDKDLNINWNINFPIVSEKDNSAFTFNEWLKKPESKCFTI